MLASMEPAFAGFDRPIMGIGLAHGEPETATLEIGIEALDAGNDFLRDGRFRPWIGLLSTRGHRYLPGWVDVGPWGKDRGDLRICQPGI